MRPEHVLVPEHFSTFIERKFGDLGRTWLANIPELVSRYAKIWQLNVGPPFADLTYNYVAPVTREDGTQAVLKVGLPEREQRAEIFALRAFAGRGIVSIFESNIDDYVSLLERLTPGQMLLDLFLEQDDDATFAAARIMNELARPVPDESEVFPSLNGWATRGMRGLRETFDGGTGPFPRDIVERAESLFDALLASTASDSLIHGDLHHMNILSSNERGGWLAIDPKGVVGDRAYEVAPFILNPNTHIHEVVNLRSLLARRIDILSERLNIDRSRIHGWTLAFSVLSAWGLGFRRAWKSHQQHWPGRGLSSRLLGRGR